MIEMNSHRALKRAVPDAHAANHGQPDDVRVNNLNLGLVYVDVDEDERHPVRHHQQSAL